MVDRDALMAGTEYAKNKSPSEALRWAISRLGSAHRLLIEAGETDEADTVRRLRNRMARKRRALAEGESDER